MDNKREHRTPPLARVMGVGRQQQHHMEEAYYRAGVMTVVVIEPRLHVCLEVSFHTLK